MNPTTTQPGSNEMNVMGGGLQTAKQDIEQGQCEHRKAWRLRGAGAGKDCFLALFGCFLCSECCEGCCDIIGDIICCPCEMLC